MNGKISPLAANQPTRLGRSQRQLEMQDKSVSTFETAAKTAGSVVRTDPAQAVHSQVEIDGPEGPDPTRYGDWERNGRCIDF